MDKKSADKMALKNKTSLKRRNGSYELPEITKDLLCPVCQQKGINLTRTLYKLPDGDEVLILLLECNQCSYKKSDMIPMFTVFKPGVYTLVVDDGDLTHKIFRGSTGNIEIPEIGISIERGSAATFDFTNLEGILLKMKEQLEFFKTTTPHDSKEWINANEAYQRLKNCISGRLNFTVILTDDNGGSYLVPAENKSDKLKFVPFK